MNRTLKILAFSCATGLLLAGAAIGPADAHGGGGGGHGGGGGGGGYIGGSGHSAGGHGYGGGNVAHFSGGHYGHGFRHGRFFAGGDGFYLDDYAYPDYAYSSGGGCSYARHMWHRTGSSYWHHRYDACLSG